MNIDLKQAIIIKNFVMALPGDYGLTANELKNHPSAWDGREIFHGSRMPLSIREWPERFIGRVFNVKFVDNALRGDAYLCPQAVEKIRPGLSDQIKANEAAVRIKLHFAKQTRGVLPLGLLVPEIRINNAMPAPPKVLQRDERPTYQPENCHGIPDPAPIFTKKPAYRPGPVNAHGIEDPPPVLTKKGK